ncbi:MAG TPA: zf-HC2 domain-containing protein [Candidatus Sulfotelmatobacter sp.]|nr:zf-HC2 domain-containing protein [Candidatus Sulfotelmatobacter sp.]
MRCTEAKPLFSSYLDGAVSGTEMHEVSGHLRECAACQTDYNLLENTRSLVSSLGRRQSPSDLALKIKVAISSENARSRRSILQGYMVRLENTFNGFMFPATAGLLSAIVFFGVLIALLVPARVNAYDDVPSSFYTPPRLQLSEYPEPQLDLDSPVVIETYVDASGRVENYRIISGRDDEEVREQLNRALLFTIFAPAQSFGRPVPGKAIMSFSHINVKG